MGEFQTAWDPTESKSFDELIAHYQEGGVRAQKYADIIASADCRFFSAGASESWDLWLSREKRFEGAAFPGLENDLSFFSSVLGGHLLTDLGSGKESFMRSFARRFGVKLFLEVDLAYRKSEGMSPDTDDTLQIIRTQEDMLRAVALMPDSCSNFTINGIGLELITSREYHAALAHELVRATQPHGVIFGFGSDVSAYLEKYPELNNRGLESTNVADHFVFQKRAG